MIRRRLSIRPLQNAQREFRCRIDYMTSADNLLAQRASILQPLITEYAAESDAYMCTHNSDYCASEYTSDILVNTRHPACSAELHPVRAISEKARGSQQYDAIEEDRAMPSSEPGQPALSVDPSVSHQGEGRRPEPELSAPLPFNAHRTSAPLTSHRRATVGDCSEITSPPKSAPSAPSPGVPQAGPSSAVSGTRIARNAAKRASAKPTVRVGKGKKKEKVLYTPLEYAQKLQAQLSEQAAGQKKQSDKPFLKGKRIFYYGGDLNYASGQTRNRMEIDIEAPIPMLRRYSSWIGETERRTELERSSGMPSGMVAGWIS